MQLHGHDRDAPAAERLPAVKCETGTDKEGSRRWIAGLRLGWEEELTARGVKFRVGTAARACLGVTVMCQLLNLSPLPAVMEGAWGDTLETLDPKP